MRGKFITVEGIDGAGKSTHLAWLAQRLPVRGVDVRLTREPGGTEVGEALRRMVLEGRWRLHPETETLMIFAARREHLDKVILPALEAGSWVLCDRFTDATYAYQSGGSGVDWERVRRLEQWTQGNLQPDATLLFDVAPEVGRSRCERLKQPDRFEQEQDAFYQAVRRAYLRRAAEHPQRIRVIDAQADVDSIHAELERWIEELCG
jgi:dTMP kinase